MTKLTRLVCGFRLSGGVLVLGWVALASACASGRQEPVAAPAAAPAAEPASSDASAPPGSGRAPLEFRDLPEALAALARAEREISELLPGSVEDESNVVARDEMESGSAPKASARENDGPSRSRRATAPSAAPESPQPSAEKGDTDVQRCARICRALASMQRAAQGICRIAGDTSEHCTAAQGDLTRTQSRAARCACPHE